MKTITAIGRQFGLSRSTLLYYDRIGLLSPSYRTHAEARLYQSDDETRLEQIMTFRRAGIPLETIKALLEAAPLEVNQTLERRLAEIDAEINALRLQQRFIVELLKDAVVRGDSSIRSKDQWVALLRACAFREADMRAWHAEMERKDPAAHERFLQRIGLSAGEIARVRGARRTGLKQAAG